MSKGIRSLSTIQFGLTDYCDLRCIMCPQTDYLGLYAAENEKGEKLHEGKRGFMDIELYRKILAECARDQIKLNIVSLIWLGESLLHPDFLTFFEEGIDFGEQTGLLEAMVFNTNAQQLRPEVSQQMLTFYSQHARQVRATVTFSLDAIRESTFHKLKPGANPHLILDNVYQFLVEYARLYKEFKMPFTVLLQMIILKENAEEAGEFLAYWQKILNELKLPFDVGYSAFGECEGNNPLRIVFKRASVKYQEEMTQLHHQTMMKLGLASPEEKSLFHLNQQQVEKEKIDTEEQTHRSPCVAVFDTMVVNWDGRVTPCCADSNLELEVGNLQENSLFGVLNNPTINALRLAHIQGDFKDFPRCSYCSNAVLPAQELERIHKRCQEAGLKI